jgi:hypothetical protein
VAIAMAVASGAKGAEAAVVLTEGEVSSGDLEALRDFAGPGIPVHRGGPAGSIQDTTTT